MKRALYIDPFAYTTTHEMFNAALLAMCSHVFNSVTYIAGKDSSTNVTKLAHNHLQGNVTTKYCYVWRGNGRWNFLMRFVIGALQNMRFLLTSPKDYIIIYNYNNLFALKALNIINKYTKRDILIFCHGELEALSSDINKAGLLSQLLNKLAKDFFLTHKANISSKINFVVMVPKLKENLSKILAPKQIERFVCVDHSYIFRDGLQVSPKPDNKLHLGTIGVMNKAKGIDKYVKLYQLLPQSVKTQISFSIIGNIQTDNSILAGTDIHYETGDIPLPRDEYDRRVQELDYILYFYSSDAYKITASGAIFDAINIKKPIIAIRNDYFQYLFDTYGAFGYLVEDVMQMAELILQIKEGKMCNEWDFDSIQHKLLPQSVAPQLENIITKLGNNLQ